MSSVIYTILSFYLNTSDNMYWLWLSFLLLSTLYSYAWDIKKDFGFLEPNSKNLFLRDRLYYPYKSFYYSVIFINLILRFTWTLTLSPNALKNILYKTMITTLLGIFETFRRTIWNYIRVELENLNYETDYNTVEGFELPIDVGVDYKDEKLKGFINKLMENEISHIRNVNKNEFIINRNFNFEEADHYLNNF